MRTEEGEDDVLLLLLSSFLLLDVQTNCVYLIICACFCARFIAQNDLCFVSLLAVSLSPVVCCGVVTHVH